MRAMWTCPECGRAFANRNQSHFCSHLRFEDHFKGRAPNVVATFDRLLAAVVAEQKRRGMKPSASIETPDKPRTEAAAVRLTPGKLNAVRAAFKAGVKPRQIARQFGLSQSDVRKALANPMPGTS